MAIDDDNPYKSPSTITTAHLSVSARLTCPNCKAHTFPFWKLYWRPPLWPFRCPNCRAKLKLAKSGFGRWSAVILGLPCGLYGGLVAVVWLCDLELSALIDGVHQHFTPTIFFMALAATLTADFFVDRLYVYIRCLESSESGPETKLAADRCPDDQTTEEQ